MGHARTSQARSSQALTQVGRGTGAHCSGPWAARTSEALTEVGHGHIREGRVVGGDDQIAEIQLVGRGAVYSRHHEAASGPRKGRADPARLPRSHLLAGRVSAWGLRFAVWGFGG